MILESYIMLMLSFATKWKGMFFPQNENIQSIISFPKPLVKSTIYFISKNRTLKNYLFGILIESMFLFKVDAEMPTSF